MSETYNSWNDGAGHHCGCFVYNAPDDLYSAVSEDWAGAGSYVIFYQGEDGEQESWVFAKTIEELTEQARDSIKENNPGTDFADELDFLERFDYVDKVC